MAWLKIRCLSAHIVFIVPTTIQTSLKLSVSPSWRLKQVEQQMKAPRMPKMKLLKGRETIMQRSSAASGNHSVNQEQHLIVYIHF